MLFLFTLSSPLIQSSLLLLPLFHRTLSLTIIIINHLFSFTLSPLKPTSDHHHPPSSYPSTSTNAVAYLPMSIFRYSHNPNRSDKKSSTSRRGKIIKKKKETKRKRASNGKKMQVGEKEKRKEKKRGKNPTVTTTCPPKDARELWKRNAIAARAGKNVPAKIPSTSPHGRLPSPLPGVPSPGQGSPLFSVWPHLSPPPPKASLSPPLGFLHPLLRPWLPSPPLVASLPPRSPRSSNPSFVTPYVTSATQFPAVFT